MKKTEVHCLACTNEAVVVINNPDVYDDVEYCPFCGAELFDQEEEFKDYFDDSDND